MTDITLGLPTGGFYWRGGVPGPLCGATVTWACDYAATEPVAIPPFIDFFGPNVVVTNILPECESIPSYVSPGVLTLTPTVTCPNPDPEQPPIVTVLAPLYLTITEGGCSASAPCIDTLCPFPRDPGFEDGTLAEWAHGNNAAITTENVYTGTYAVKLPQVGAYVGQIASGACPRSGSWGLSFRAYAAVQSSVRISMRQYNNYALLDDYVVDPVGIIAGGWRNLAVSRALDPQMNNVQFDVWANDPDIFVDAFYCDIC